MLKIIETIFGNAQKKQVDKKRQTVAKINALESEMKKLSDIDLKNKTFEFKEKVAQGTKLDSLLVEAFAVVREAAFRVIGQRAFDTQLVGAMALHEGKIAEMKTGEGKTLVAVFAGYLNALSGKGVHVVTVNDYLSKRDANWKGAIYHFLGMSTACLNHDVAYLYQPAEEKVPPFEKVEPLADENMVKIERKQAYEADILYGTNNEFGFDYLRDNMAQSLEHMVQRPLNYAIVDEVDSILIDEARTPLIISAPDMESGQMYEQFARLVPRLQEGEDYNIDEKLRSALLTNEGIEKMEKWLGIGNIYETGKISYVHHLEQALKAEVLFKNDKDYVVKDGEVVIVDDFTGRLMPGRRYSEGLHQAIEAKEGVAIQKESRTLATITFQNYFRIYNKLAGMTGTALTSAEEFDKVYKLDVLEIPTNKEVVRKDLADVIYKTEKGKFNAIVGKISELHKKGQPVLVGTVAIEKSEYLADMLKKRGVPHEVLNAKNHAREAQIIAKAGQKGAVTIATNMAGRGTDIKIGGALRTDKEFKEVWNLDGLCIIGSERHEARRIDNQLRGRAGRQGEPGVTQFYVSLEDELMRRFGGDKLKAVMNRLGLPEDEPIENKLISRSIESAQNKIEGFNFDARKRVLEYDDVMNKQRETIYKRRKELLEKEEVRKEIDELIKEEIHAVVHAHTVDENPEKWNREEIAENFQAIANIQDKNFHQGLIGLEKQKEITKYLQEKIENRIKEKKEELGEDQFKAIQKNLYLRTIDNLWMDHLEQMDHVRGSIGFQGYGQRDPLVMYKKEGFQMFQRLLNSIRQSVVSNLFKVQIALPEQIAASVLNNANYSGGELPDQFSAPQNPQNPNDPKIPLKDKKPVAPIVNKDQIGRNDLCPCGSGKKYKKCCGK